MTIAAPNGTQPIWSFAQTEPQGGAQVAIAYGKNQPSNLLLPQAPAFVATTGELALALTAAGHRSSGVGAGGRGRTLGGDLVRREQSRERDRLGSAT